MKLNQRERGALFAWIFILFMMGVAVAINMLF